jgi:hypothetical protein
MVEAITNSVCEDLEEQRCIIEGQQVEIRRQQHQIEMQHRRIDYLEAELAAIKGALRRATPIRPRTQRSPSHGNGKGNGNGNGHHTALQLSTETMSRSDET